MGGEEGSGCGARRLACQPPRLMLSLARCWMEMFRPIRIATSGKSTCGRCLLAERQKSAARRRAGHPASDERACRLKGRACWDFQPRRRGWHFSQCVESVGLGVGTPSTPPLWQSGIRGNGWQRQAGQMCVPLVRWHSILSLWGRRSACRLALHRSHASRSAALAQANSRAKIDMHA